MSSFLTQLNISAAKEAKIPFKRRIENPSIAALYHATRAQRRAKPQPSKSNPRTSYTHTRTHGEIEASARTGEVVHEGDRDGAAHDGVDPEPPPGAEHGAGDARPEDRPQFGQIHGNATGGFGRSNAKSDRLRFGKMEAEKSREMVASRVRLLSTQRTKANASSCVQLPGCNVASGGNCFCFVSLFYLLIGKTEKSEFNCKKSQIRIPVTNLS